MAFFLSDSLATEAAGAALAKVLPSQAVIYLRGDLGAGKTTLVRGLLRGLGYGGKVPSPTYTLVEGYEAAGRTIQHLDLYRIADPGELDYLGVRDLGGVILIEWPERGGAALPPPDLDCRLALSAEGRTLAIQATSPLGTGLRKVWSDALKGLGLTETGNS